MQSTKVNNSHDTSKEEVIRTLDRSLENSEKKFLKLQSESELARNELTLLRAKVEQYEKRGGNLLEMLLKAYSEFENDNLMGTSGGYQIDLTHLRKRNPEEWSREEMKLVINALLQQVASFLNRKSLNLPSAFRPEEFSVLDSDETINNVRLPSNS